MFYTTPLKALSNQKLRDFRDQFGYHQVGLLTGDVSINRDAPVVVMTTEIFRNMLYGTRIGETGTTLQQVEAVVLDECHYMNDRQRGTVWEESIIYCPPEIQLLALSATVDNSDQLTDWLQRVHGPTELIYSNFRPVPPGVPLLHQQKTGAPAGPKPEKKFIPSCVSIVAPSGGLGGEGAGALACRLSSASCSSGTCCRPFTLSSVGGGAIAPSKRSAPCP